MKLIWYNSETSYYQSGTWQDYSSLRSKSKNPENILILERFNKESLAVISKITKELNKCQ